VKGPVAWPGSAQPGQGDRLFGRLPQFQPVSTGFHLIQPCVSTHGGLACRAIRVCGEASAPADHPAARMSLTLGHRPAESLEACYRVSLSRGGSPAAAGFFVPVGRPAEIEYQGSTRMTIQPSESRQEYRRSRTSLHGTASMRPFVYYDESARNGFYCLTGCRQFESGAVLVPARRGAAISAVRSPSFRQAGRCCPQDLTTSPSSWFPTRSIRLSRSSR